MKLLIGLGNPGEKYKNNRHNVGFMFVDFLADKDIKAFKTDCFMNESGRFVSEKVNFFKISPSDLVVVHDDLDLKIGEFKINFGKGPELHNGILSSEESLGTKDFWRIRIGVDNRTEKIPGETYVLQDFKEEEREVLNKLFPEIYENLRKHLS